MDGGTEMAEIENPAEGWEYPNTLPESYQGFSRELENQWDGLLYRIFSYKAEGRRRCVSVVFDKNTQEYMLRLTVGLTEFCDVNFIHGDRQAFEAILRIALLQRLETFKQCVPEKMESLFRNKKILDWERETNLPQQINGFELFLSPRDCLQFTNGSYLILDYSDFAQNSSLRFFYNVFRDDFFAEYLVLGAPQATQRFDSQSLSELSEKFKRDLDDATLELRSRIQVALSVQTGRFSVND
jgi:hypothetical protein